MNIKIELHILRMGCAMRKSDSSGDHEFLAKKSIRKFINNPDMNYKLETKNMYEM